jgi:hypothetical protein
MLINANSTISTINGAGFFAQRASMIAHTMIVTISVMFLTSLPKPTHHMNRIVHTVVSFLDAYPTSHSSFPAPVGILAAFFGPLDAPHTPDRILPSPLSEFFLVFLCKNEDASTVFALKVFFHLKQLLFIIYQQRGNPLLNTKWQRASHTTRKHAA